MDKANASNTSQCQLSFSLVLLPVACSVYFGRRNMQLLGLRNLEKNVNVNEIETGTKKSKQKQSKRIQKKQQLCESLRRK